jgi:hypothetical protein
MATKSSGVDIKIESTATINATIVKRFRSLPSWKQRILVWCGENFKKSSFITATIGAFLAGVFGTFGTSIAEWIMLTARSACG